MPTKEEIKNALDSRLKEMRFVSAVDTQPFASEAAINELENLIGTSIPPLSYHLSFLELANGGIAEDYSFFAYGTKGFAQVERYSQLFGLYDSPDMQEFDLRAVYKNYKEHIPSDLLPIASVKNIYSKTFLCVGLDRKISGEIYLYQISKEFSGPTYSNTSYVAGDLLNFFLGCYFLKNYMRDIS